MDLRAADDRLTPVDDLLDVGEQAIGDLKFADCIPDWLAKTNFLARLTDQYAVRTTGGRPIDQLWGSGPAT